MEIKNNLSLFSMKFLVLIFPVFIIACGGSNSNRENDRITNNRENAAPIVNVELSDTVAREFNEFTINILIVDVDEDDILVEIENLPSWAEFDPELLIISGLPQPADVGSVNNVTIIADDGTNQTRLTTVVEVVDTESLVLSGNIYGVEFDEYVVSLEIVGGQLEGFEFFQNFKPDNFTGNFLIDIPVDILSQFPDDLIMLRVQENSDDTPTLNELVSVLGVVDDLINSAGEDNELTSDEFPRLNLSPVSTAKYLYSISNGLPETFDELIDSENSLLAEDIIKLAALYRFTIEESIDFNANRLTTVFSRLDLNPLFEITNVIEQLDLESLSTQSAEAIIVSIEELKPIVMAESGISSSFIVKELPGISVITQPFLSGELPYVVADVADIGFNGRGEFHHRYNEGLQWIRRFGWSVSDSQFTMEFDSAQEPGRVVVPRNRLIEDFGFDQDVVDFFANLEVPQDLIQVRSTDLRTDYNVVFVTEDRWQLVVEREVENNIGFAVSQAGGSFDQFSPVTHSIRENRVLITSAITDNRGLILSEDLIDQPWALPSRNIIDFDRRGLDRGNVVLPEIYTLFGDGFSSEGDNGGPVYEWSIQDTDAIVLDVPLRESYTIHPIFELDNRYFGYVREEFNGFLELLGTVEFAQVDEQSSVLFNDELVLPGISSESAPFWLRINGKRSPENFREDGLLSIENISGFLFDTNGNLMEVSGINNDCLENNTPCFQVSEEASSLDNNDNPVAFSRQGDFNFSLGDFNIINTRWRVLDYDQETEVVLIILSELDSSESTNAVTPPKLIQLQKRNLNEWREEFLASGLVVN